MESASATFGGSGASSSEQETRSSVQTVHHPINDNQHCISEHAPKYSLTLCGVSCDSLIIYQPKDHHLSSSHLTFFSLPKSLTHCLLITWLCLKNSNDLLSWLSMSWMTLNPRKSPVFAMFSSRMWRAFMTGGVQSMLKYTCALRHHRLNLRSIRE